MRCCGCIEVAFWFLRSLTSPRVTLLTSSWIKFQNRSFSPLVSGLDAWFMLPESVCHVSLLSSVLGVSIYAQIHFFKYKISVYTHEWLPKWARHNSAAVNCIIWISSLSLYPLAHSAQASNRRLLNVINKSLLANLFSCKILENNSVHLQNGVIVNREFGVKFSAGNLKAYTPFIFFHYSCLLLSTLRTGPLLKAGNRW